MEPQISYGTQSTINELLDNEIRSIKPVLLHLEHQLSLPHEDRILENEDDDDTHTNQLVRLKFTLQRLNSAKKEFQDFVKR